MNKKIDPVTMQVIGGALDTIAKEMSHVMQRMAYSSLIRESEDLGAGVFTKFGETLAESDSTPMQLGCLPGYIEGFQEVLGDNQHPEDIIWNNDPYAGASHSPDVSLSQPIFYKGELVGYAGTTAHHLDIGGAQPGLIVDAPDVYAEGLVLNGVKLYDKGQPNETLYEIIRQKVRTSSQVIGDLEAQVAACRLGTKRFIELIEKYGKDTVLAAGEELMNYSERMMRKEISNIPDGEYEAESWLDDDGINLNEKLKVHVNVIKQGSELEIDVSKSADQVASAFNAAYSGALCVGVYSVVRSIFLDTYTHEEFVPANHGVFRPIKVTARKGSIFNPIRPAATFSRANQVNTAADLIIKALTPVIPERTCAGSAANIQFASYSGLDEEHNYWVYIEVNEGSYRGRPEKDGMDAMDFSSWNTRNNPIEDLDMHTPMICEQYELREDTGGAGKTRGGLGIIRRNRFLTDGLMSMEGDKHTVKPWGYNGGLPGTEASLIKNPDTKPEELPSKLNGERFNAGESVKIMVPSSGGYGDPLEQQASKVYEDVLDEIISVETALNDYGVVIEKGQLNMELTEKKRNEMRQQRGEMPLFTQ
ncbi:hydantoinase B/oxoprolinase family protein [Lentibacillus cibarius]|uniref:Hydantoinase B/oxoprolinase family protein n=1 Tax=Lentibacillus cibarius TaxID=2583219 RepID=A0A5S3QIK6_9BACI|nr:hydantoinase B/oxoprolinase family protein [Lentibacillus cibarius]TMN21658.1 hydantoinase B/oxoprolinase family protein [Lentibacillus cibarius]